MNLQWFDLALLLFFGLIGLGMRRFGIPVLPLIIGVILGPRVEEELRKTLLLSSGEWNGLVGEPTAIIVYAIIVLGFIGMVLTGIVRGRREDHTTEVSA